ncbi:MAG: VCBS repeat-containing protein [Nonomuraea sp.]|nr:VCBS repeat-containing protein [Nonomuraea sp.]
MALKRAAVSALALVVAACATSTPPRKTRTPKPRPSRTYAAPLPTSPAPTGSPVRGAARHSDVNGDGRADLALSFRDDQGTTWAIVVYGSRQGLDQATRTVVRATAGVVNPRPGDLADLDGDGYGDLVDGLSVMWGGPRGLDPKNGHTPLRRPPSDVRRMDLHSGDADGDGAADVIATGGRDGNPALYVLKGPFTRKGRPARSEEVPAPISPEYGWLVADRIGDRHPTSVIVYGDNDGEQATGWLVPASRGGLAAKGRQLNTGSAAAFGDFDGDGRRDVVVGDNGSRNDEPGAETEATGVDRTLTVHYGTGRQEALTGAWGETVAGDFDGDGRDDLVVGTRIAGNNAMPPWLFTGTPDGLRNSGAFASMRRGTPLTAGDYDGDGDDEVVFYAGFASVDLWVADRSKVLATFDTNRWIPGS